MIIIVFSVIDIEKIESLEDQVDSLASERDGLLDKIENLYGQIDDLTLENETLKLQLS